MPARSFTTQRQTQSQLTRFIEKTNIRGFFTYRDGYDLSKTEKTSFTNKDEQKPDCLQKIVDKVGGGSWNALIVKPNQTVDVPVTNMMTKKRIICLVPVPHSKSDDYKFLSTETAEDVLERTIEGAKDDSVDKSVRDVISMDVNQGSISISHQQYIDNNYLLEIKGEIASGINIRVNNDKSAKISSIRPGGRPMVVGKNVETRCIVIIDVINDMSEMMTKAMKMKSLFEKKGFGDIIDKSIESLIK